MEDAHRKFQQRAEAFSTESNVYLEGKYRINVDIPGAKDAQAVLDKLGSAGSVYFIYAKDKNGVANVTEQDGKYVLARSLEDIINYDVMLIEYAEYSTSYGIPQSSPVHQMLWFQGTTHCGNLLYDEC